METKQERRETWKKFLAKEAEDQVHCPRCALHYPHTMVNTLSTMGDYPDTLTCPRCMLEVDFKISYNGRDGL